MKLAASLSLVFAICGYVPVLAQVAYDYTGLYEKLSPSIVKVETDSGSGSGFLVDPSGLIATNHHVVKTTRFLAVQFPSSVSATAEIVKLSPRYDLAVLKVHPKFREGLQPLTLVSDSEEKNLRAGLPVVAFGSPLSQTFLATQGIISKVEDLYITLMTTHARERTEPKDPKTGKSKSPSLESRSLPLQEALSSQRLVVIGDPGSSGRLPGPSVSILPS